MLIGIFANIISKDPSKFKIKSKNTMQHLRLFFITILSVFIFIYLYSIIQKSYNDNFLNFLFTTFKLALCFIICGTLMYTLVKIRVINKNLVNKSYIEPIKNFIIRYGKFAVIILLLISLYRIADVVMGVMANLFYLEKVIACLKLQLTLNFLVFLQLYRGYLRRLFCI